MNNGRQHSGNCDPQLVRGSRQPASRADGGQGCAADAVRRPPFPTLDTTALDYAGLWRLAEEKAQAQRELAEAKALLERMQGGDKDQPRTRVEEPDIEAIIRDVFNTKK